MCLGNKNTFIGKVTAGYDSNNLFNDEIGRDDLHNDTTCNYAYVNNVTHFGNLNTLHLNIRSLNKNKDNLSELLHQLSNAGVDVDIILLCETWLNAENDLMPQIDGYDYFLQNRSIGRGGGIAIFIRKCFSAVIRDDIDFNLDEYYESLFVDVTFGKKIITVVEIYRIPNSSESVFNDDFGKLLAKISSKSLILGSDQNLDLLKGNIHKPTSEFLETIFACGLIPSVTKPTRVSQSTCTLIDNVYVSLDLFDKISSDVILEYMSDHFPCLLQIQSPFRESKAKSHMKIVYSRKLNDKKNAALNHELLHKNWLSVLSSASNVDDMYSFFLREIGHSLDKIAPVKKSYIW